MKSVTILLCLLAALATGCLSQRGGPSTESDVEQGPEFGPDASHVGGSGSINTGGTSMGAGGL